MTHQELKEAIKTAMKNKEEVKLSVLRGLSAAATNELVAKKRKPDELLNEDELMTLISRAAKQRKDSIEQFEKGGRSDLAAKEKEELAVIQALLPAQMSEAEIEAAAKAKAAELGVTDKNGANKVMGALMKDLKGRADGTLVKAIVDKLFQ
jgi:uncharacterized protein YqeY